MRSSSSARTSSTREKRWTAAAASPEVEHPTPPVVLSVPLTITVAAFAPPFVVNDPVIEVVRLASTWKVLAPVVRGRKGEYDTLLEDLSGQGYVRARIDGETVDIDEFLKRDERLAKYENHKIEIVVDRLVLKEGIERRLTDSLETALGLAEGVAEIEIVKRADEGENETLTFSTKCARLGGRHRRQWRLTIQANRTRRTLKQWATRLSIQHRPWSAEARKQQQSLFPLSLSPSCRYPRPSWRRRRSTPSNGAHRLCPGQAARRLRRRPSCPCPKPRSRPRQ